MSYPPDEHPQLRVSEPGDGDRVMACVLDEMGALVRTRPGMDATDAEVAAWYERKAAMLRHVAASGGPDAGRAAEWAVLAAQHAAVSVAA